MKKRNFAISTLSLALALAIPASAQNGPGTTLITDPPCGFWTLEDFHPQGDFPPNARDTCEGISYGGEGIAYAASAGHWAEGSGWSWENSVLPCEVRVQNNATDYYLQTWTYTPCRSETGWAKLHAEVEARGSVTLHSSNTGAAAVGYALAQSTLISQVTAELNESAAETSASNLGEISLEIEGFGASIPVLVSSGTGHFPDLDIDSNVGQDCLNFFDFKRKSRAQMEFFSDEFGTTLAECEGSMTATAGGSRWLSICNPSTGGSSGIPVPEYTD